MRSILPAQSTRPSSTTGACKRTRSADHTDGVFQSRPGRESRARPGAARNDILPRVGRPQRPLGSVPRGAQTGTCRRVARAVRFVPAVRDPRAAALAVRCDPAPAARGNCGPLARLARRASFGRPRGFVSVRSGRRHAGRVSSDARDLGARGARPFGIGCRGAPAKTLRTLVSLRRPSLRFFTGAGFPAERAGLRSRGAFSLCASASPPRSLQDRGFEFARGLLRAHTLQASSSCVTAEPHRTPRAPTPAQRSPRSVFRPRRPARPRRPNAGRARYARRSRARGQPARAPGRRVRLRFRSSPTHAGLVLASEGGGQGILLFVHQNPLKPAKRT